MNGTLVCYFEQSGSLFGCQGTGQMDVALNSVEHRVFSFAVGAIGRVYLPVSEMNRNLLERPFLPASVHAEGNRSAGSQRCEQKLIRRRSRIRPAGGCGFIRGHPMAACKNFLCESSAAAADRYACATGFASRPRAFLM